MNVSLSNKSEQHDSNVESTDETKADVGKDYIATLALGSNTQTEFIILESLVQLDGALETPFLLFTEETEGNAVKTQIIIDNNDKEVFEVHCSPDVDCETKKQLLKQTVSKNGKASQIQTQNDEALARVERKSTSNCQHKPKFLKCDFEGCCRTFMWPAHLKYHSLTHTGSRHFKCSFKDCDKSFYTQQRLDVHLRTHTGERPFTCNVRGCDKSFTTAGNLKNHMRVHTGEKPFVCEIQECGKRFAELSSLKKHSLVHTGNKPFSCDICGKMFSQLGSRNVHHKRHHSRNESTMAIESSVTSSLAIRNGGISEILRNGKHTTITLPQGIQVVEFSKDEVNFNFGEAIVIPATISANADLQQTIQRKETGDEAMFKKCEGTKFLPSDGNLAYSVILPHSNANVLVLAQPQSIPELGYHLPPTERNYM